MSAASRRIIYHFPRLLNRNAGQTLMPKSTIRDLPVSALFGIVKPSGPSSMSVINDLKKLVSASRLFVDVKSAKENAERLYCDGGGGGDADELGGAAAGKKKQKKWRKGKGKEKSAEAKMGQGGTLDPLADGVLVVGVNRGTKKLSEFLDCIKEYRTTCLLGCETDTYDCEGVQVRAAPWRHVTRESVEAALEKFRGEVEQTPPIFSALKMDGRPLYEYAREGIPLPRPIERRRVTVHSLELTHWIPGSDHSYAFPAKKFSDEERERMQKALRGAEVPVDAVIRDEGEGEGEDGDGDGDGDRPGSASEGGSASSNENENENENEPAEGSKKKRKKKRSKKSKDTGTETEKEKERPPAFVLSMRVSGGTYVRSIVHDLGHALGSAAHVVTLTRARQGRFVLSPLSLSSSSSSSSSTATRAEAETETETAAEAAGVVVVSTPLLPDEHSTVAAAAAAAESPDAKSAESSGEVNSTVNARRARASNRDKDKDKEVECIPWDVFARALEKPTTEEPDEDGWREWEREVMQKLEYVEAR